LWIATAFSVAFPEHFFTLEFDAITRGFVTGKERYYLGLLLLIDLFIDEDFWTRAVNAAATHPPLVHWLARVFLLNTVLYVAIVSFIALNASAATSYAGVVTALAILCLAYPRMLSYLRPTPPLRRV
jgi:hypothetical protein